MAVSVLSVYKFKCCAWWIKANTAKNNIVQVSNDNSSLLKNKGVKKCSKQKQGHQEWCNGYAELPCIV